MRRRSAAKPREVVQAHLRLDSALGAHIDDFVEPLRLVFVVDSLGDFGFCEVRANPDSDEVAAVFREVVELAFNLVERLLFVVAVPRVRRPAEVQPDWNVCRAVFEREVAVVGLRDFHEVFFVRRCANAFAGCCQQQREHCARANEQFQFLHSVLHIDWGTTHSSGMKTSQQDLFEWRQGAERGQRAEIRAQKNRVGKSSEAVCGLVFL